MSHEYLGYALSGVWCVVASSSMQGWGAVIMGVIGTSLFAIGAWHLLTTIGNARRTSVLEAKLEDIQDDIKEVKSKLDRL